ncbi:Cullin-1 [Venturia inaequalis]|nr:Cullin-1 [Venturia inaequalis]
MAPTWPPPNDHHRFSGALIVKYLPSLFWSRNASTSWYAHSNQVDVHLQMEAGNMNGRESIISKLDGEVVKDCRTMTERKSSRDC